MKGTVAITGEEVSSAERKADDRNKEMTCKYFAPFTDCIDEINNTQIGNTNNLDVVMPMYNLTEYRDNYAKASGILWQY